MKFVNTLNPNMITAKTEKMMPSEYRTTFVSAE
jgi:hypothetical protein